MVHFTNSLKILVGAFWITGILGFLQACTYDVLPEPADCGNAPLVNLGNVEDANCGQATGSIAVSASGGTGFLSFSINGNNFQTEPVFSGLNAGSYTVTVKDENNCTATLETIVKNSDGLNITVSTTDAGCGTANGSVNISAIGGEVPYQFKIDGGGFQAKNTFTGLPNGTHTVTAKDASGCEITQEVTLASGIAFESVQAIIKSNCAISSCHGGSTAPDFRKADNIKSRAATIKSRTGSKSMPPPSSGLSLTSDEIEKIACWADDGALLSN